MNRRIVVTGCGVVSSIGNSCREVLQSLQQNRSGIVAMPQWEQYGFKSLVAGTIKLPDVDSLRNDFGQKARFMDVSGLYSLICAEEAVAASGIDRADLASERAACIVGSGFSNSEPYRQALDRIEGRARRIGPFEVTRSMASSVSANLAFFYGIKGRSYSISSACATSLHNIGHAYELIKSGICDLAIAGGAEEVSPVFTCMFDGMRKVMSSGFNNEPQRASRAYDKNRDGFVISGGAGVVVLEEYERALARNAPIYGEIIGFGTSSDGHDIVQPDPEGMGCYRCIETALHDAKCSIAEIDYINTHGTSTPIGDFAETGAIRKIFGDLPVRISSTKSLTGHGIGATGAQEIIYCLLMMNEGFVTASVNIDDLDEPFEGLNIVRRNETCELNKVLTNSFGFGGTNGSMILSKVN